MNRRINTRNGYVIPGNYYDTKLALEEQKIKDKKKKEAEEEKDKIKFKHLAQVEIILKTNIVTLPEIKFRPNMCESMKNAPVNTPIFITPNSQVSFKNIKEDPDRYNDYFYNRIAYDTLLNTSSNFGINSSTPEDKAYTLMYNFKSMADTIFKPSRVLYLQQSDDKKYIKRKWDEVAKRTPSPFTIISYDILTYEEDIAKQLAEDLNLNVRTADEVFKFKMTLYLFEGKDIPPEKLSGIKCTAIWKKVLDNSGPLQKLFPPVEKIYTKFKVRLDEVKKTKKNKKGGSLYSRRRRRRRHYGRIKF